MASTYTLISSQVLASSASSVTFSSIPATYTDLVLRISTRGSLAGYFTNQYITFNSDTATNYSDTYLYSDSTTGGSAKDTNTSIGYVSLTDGSSADANNFGSAEIYIPNYNSSTYKPYSVTSVYENNASINLYGNWVLAGLWRNTSAVTSINVSSEGTGYYFLANSSFYLYGIKNS
jgi:hypothetical protein